LVQEELAYGQHLLTTDAENVEDRFNDDQHRAYKTILNAITNKEGKLFFVYGSGGTGKTFVWTMLLSRLRGQGKIVLVVASSRIASLLLLGGRTAHSRFKIPIDLTTIFVRDLGYSLQHWDRSSIGKFLLSWSLNLAKERKSLTQ